MKINFNKSPLEIAEEIVGSNVVLNNGRGNGPNIGTVVSVEAYGHLIKPSMLEKFDSQQRESGDLLVLPYRAGQLINVVTKDNAELSSPTVVWIKEIRNQVGKVLSSYVFCKGQILEDVTALDGLNVNNNQFFSIEKPANKPQPNFLAPGAGSKLAANSLGVFHI